MTNTQAASFTMKAQTQLTTHLPTLYILYGYRLWGLQQCKERGGGGAYQNRVKGDKWRGTGGREPGRTGGGRGSGDGRRKGGRRERNSKRQAFAICYCLLPVKETNPRTFLDFHLTFSEAYSKILYTRKFKKRKFVLGVKKAVLLPVKLETFPSRFIHHRT